MIRRERAQSEVLGTVLLLGITIAAVTVTVATGSVALAAITDDARSAGVENGMSQFTSQTSLVALGESEAKRFDLGDVDGGDLRLDEDAGRVDIRIEDPNGTVANESFRLGTLTYTGDGREVAVQGGGVWRLEGDRGQMVSPPEYHYRGDTLTFPIVRLTGDDAPSNRGTGLVRQDVVGERVFSEVANPLQDGTVTVEVQSEYYEGWYDFFSQRADGDVTKDDENRTTTARLVVPDEMQFERAISLGHSGYSHGGGGNGSGGNNGLDETAYTEGNSHAPPEPLVATQIASAANESEDIDDCFDGTGSCGGGTYYSDSEYTLDGDVTFDTTAGDITVAIDGDLELGNKNLEITNEGDGRVTYYVNGSVTATGNAVVGTSSTEPEASRTVFYVTEGFLEDGPGQGSVDIDGIVYAPNSATELAGSPTLRGAFVFDSLHTKGNAFSVEFDTSLSDDELSVSGGPGQNPITYLHVSENTVEVRFDR
ncbi:MAG: hypothetical protein PPP55_03955 [Halorubrum sp.]